MKFGGLIVAVWDKRGDVYPVALTDEDKNYIIALINQLQNKKAIQVVEDKLPFKIDVKKMKNESKKQ